MNTSETLFNLTPPLETPTPPNGRAKLVLKLSLGMLLFSGLTLSFWGWADWRGFVAHPARCALVALMFLRFTQGMFTLPPGDQDSPSFPATHAATQEICPQTP